MSGSPTPPASLGRRRADGNNHTFWLALVVLGGTFGLLYPKLDEIPAEALMTFLAAQSTYVLVWAFGERSRTRVAEETTAAVLATPQQQMTITSGPPATATIGPAETPSVDPAPASDATDAGEMAA